MEIKTTNISFKLLIISLNEIFVYSNFLVSISVLIYNWKGNVSSGVQ